MREIIFIFNLSPIGVLPLEIKSYTHRSFMSETYQGLSFSLEFMHYVSQFSLCRTSTLFLVGAIQSSLQAVGSSC